MLGRKERKEVRSKTWRVRGTCVTPTGGVRLDPEGVRGCWEVPTSLEPCRRAVRAWAGSQPSLGRVIPSMAGGPVLWQLLPFGVLESYEITEHSEKSSQSVKVGASGRSSLVTEEIEGGLILGVPPFGEEVGYHTARLWASGFRWLWAYFCMPKCGCSCLLGR